MSQNVLSGLQFGPGLIPGGNRAINPNPSPNPSGSDAGNNGSPDTGMYSRILRSAGNAGEDVAEALPEVAEDAAPALLL